MGNFSRKMKTIRKNKKKMLEIKSTVTEMKNVFNELICRFEIFQGINH